MNEILFGIAFAIYLCIANIIWFVICLIIWPFKKEFIYNWKQCCIYLMNIHHEETCRRKKIPFKPIKYRKKFRGRSVSQKTFELVADAFSWANAGYNGYLKCCMNRSDGIRDLDQLNHIKFMWDKTDEEERAKYYPIYHHYQKRLLKHEPTKNYQYF